MTRKAIYVLVCCILELSRLFLILLRQLIFGERRRKEKEQKEEE